MLMQLDKRTDSWHEVELLWDRENDCTIVRCWTEDEGFELNIPSALALDAFQHPYAYRHDYEAVGYRAAA
jgi:hypothetical protein